jgi:RNA polymerase sigma-70 factor (ECF subfamily)
MPPADRELLYLFNVDRFPTAEIAAMLGTSPGAVRVRLSRARDRFRSSYRGTP